jgi:hypothetical protein
MTVRPARNPISESRHYGEALGAALMLAGPPRFITLTKPNGAAHNSGQSICTLPFQPFAVVGNATTRAREQV